MTSRERAAELAGLATETGRAPALRDRARSAAADAARAEAQAAAARAEAAQAREAADAARRREDRHAGVAERARAELADLPLDYALDDPRTPDSLAPPSTSPSTRSRPPHRLRRGPPRRGAPPIPRRRALGSSPSLSAEPPSGSLPSPRAAVVGAEPGVGLSVLRGAYGQACAAYAAAEVGADLSAQLGRPSGKPAARRVGSTGSTPPRGRPPRPCCAHPTPPTPRPAAPPPTRPASSWPAPTRGARQATTATALARRELAGFTAAPRSVAPYGAPTDPADGQERIDRAEQDRRVAEDAAAATARVARDAVRERDAVAASAEGFGHVVRGLDAPAHPVRPGRGTVPFTGDVAAAVEATAAARAAQSAAAGERARAEREVRAAVDAVAQFAQEPRFGTLTSPVRKHISGVARADMPALAADWAAALRPRLRSLEDDLASIGRHHAGIVTRLRGMVESGAAPPLRLGPAAVPAARGPRRLVGPGVPADPLRRPGPGGAAARARRGRSTRPTRRSPCARTPTCAATACRCCCAGCGARDAEGRARSRCSSPTPCCAPSGVPVGQMGDVFSGGQLLTAAIALYCTMAALRSNDRGRTGTGTRARCSSTTPSAGPTRPTCWSCSGGRRRARRPAALHDGPVRRGRAQRVPADHPAAQRRGPAGGPEVPLRRRPDRDGARRPRRARRLRSGRRDPRLPPPGTR